MSPCLYYHIIMSILPCHHVYITMSPCLYYHVTMSILPYHQSILPYHHVYITMSPCLYYHIIMSILPCHHVYITLSATHFQAFPSQFKFCSDNSFLVSNVHVVTCKSMFVYNCLSYQAGYVLVWTLHSVCPGPCVL